MLGVRLILVGLCGLACRSPDPIELPPEPASSTIHALDPAPPGGVRALALGLEFSCALLGSGHVKCWGAHDDGMLDGAEADVTDPAQIEPIDFGTERRVVQLSAGWHHACALFEDGRARCWGRNDRGQLGRGHRRDDDPLGPRLREVEDLPLTGISRISAGVSNSCAVVAAAEGATGTIHCWGSDFGGAIGDGQSGDFGDDEPVDASRPASLTEPALDVVAGDSVNCALLVTGEVQCFGSNEFRTLGIGDTPCNLSDERSCEGARSTRLDEPAQNLGARPIASIVLNQASACALDAGGDLFCWGRNDQSRAGYPHEIYGVTLPISPGPVRLGAGVALTGVGLGTRHGCGVDAAGAIRCWGESGPQLGYGLVRAEGVAGIGGADDPADRYALLPEGGVVQLGDADGVDGNDAALRVYSGGRHNCAILASGSVRCWGAGERGQLGYGDDAASEIGASGSPADTYARLGRHDVCVAAPSAALTTSCSSGSSSP